MSLLHLHLAHMMSPSSEPLISVLFDAPLMGTVEAEPTEKTAPVKNFIAERVEFRRRERNVQRSFFCNRLFRNTSLR